MTASVATTPRPTTVVKFDVMATDGALVSTHSNPATARSEARSISGTVVPRNVIA